MRNTIYGGTTTTPTPLVITDQNYNPESANPQSGIAVAEAIEGLGSTWEKIVDITATEEVNGIMASVEEFPDIANCKEFVARVVFPKNETGDVSLGAARIDVGKVPAFHQISTNIKKDFVCETRCHIIIADGLIFSTGTRSTSATAQLTTETGTLIGDRFASEIDKDIMYYLTDTTKMLPVGTRLEIYGKKVEIGELAEALLNEKLSDIETLLGGI